jgi:hypothetical protein
MTMRTTRPTGISPSDTVVLERGLDEATVLADGRRHAVLLYGSMATGRTWAGSDLNLAVVIDEESPCVPSVTSYLFEDVRLPSPRIKKGYINERLLQIEVIPRSLIGRAAVTDWIMADRLVGAVIVAGDASLVEGRLQTVRRERFSREVVAQRVRWYLDRARERLDAVARVSSAGRFGDAPFNQQIAAMMLGYATLERLGMGKGSYKRFPRLLAEASRLDPVAGELFGLLGYRDLDRSMVVGAVLATGGALKTFRRFIAEIFTDGGAATLPTSTRLTLEGTLRLSGDTELPRGKGIVENIEAGDSASCLDSLRKGVLWLMLMVCHVHCGTTEARFNRFEILRFLADEVSLPGATLEYLRLLWNLPTGQNAWPQRQRRLAEVCRQLEVGLQHTTNGTPLAASTQGSWR